MKKLIIIIIFATLIFGCTNNDDGDGLPYYQFTQEEKKKLIFNLNVNNEIIYKNQDNEVIKFKIYKSTNGKTTYRAGGLLGANNYFHYDAQEIAMWYVDGYETSSCVINIVKYPVGSNYLTQYPVVGTPKFYGYFTFPLWNGYYGSDQILNNSIPINFDTPTTTMSFNGKTFTKVLKFESNKTEVLSPNSTLPFYPKNVNVIYYDYNFGVIGFDDLNGKKWRIN